MSSKEMTKRALIVTDDLAVAASARDGLRDDGIEVRVAPSPAEARSMLAAHGTKAGEYQLLCVDAAWLGEEGCDLLGEASRSETPPRLALIARTEQATVRIVSVDHISEPDDYGPVAGASPFLDESSETAAFCAHHRLSRTEAALLALAVRGLNNDEAAAMLGCRRCTIGTYWSRIFRKTESRGQRDVISKLLRARYAPLR